MSASELISPHRLPDEVRMTPDPTPRCRWHACAEARSGALFCDAHTHTARRAARAGQLPLAREMAQMKVLEVAALTATVPPLPAKRPLCRDLAVSIVSGRCIAEGCDRPGTHGRHLCRACYQRAAYQRVLEQFPVKGALPAARTGA
jgi:hypothetical protein